VGYPDWDPSWKQTTDPTSWIRNSVVWYSQHITQSLGENRMRDYLVKLDYGNRDLSGHPGQGDGLTQAWLNSSLQISPREQLSFLLAVVNRQIPVSRRAYEMTNRITQVGRLPNGWSVNGKTGTGFPAAKSGELDTDHALGWFVGWATQPEKTFVFVRLMQDEGPNPVRAGLRAREMFMTELPSLLDRYSNQPGTPRSP